MRKQITVALCSTVLGLVASSSLALDQQRTARGAQGAPPPTALTAFAAARKPASARAVYSSVKEIMESIIDPSADVLWNAVATVVDQEGTHDSVPKTDAEWLEVRHAAIRVIEGANLLMMPGREAAPAGTKSEVPGVELEPAQITALIKKKRKEFDGYAKSLQGLAVESLRAIDAKNAPVLFEIGSRMQDACESCHKTFWYPLEKLPYNGN